MAPNNFAKNSEKPSPVPHKNALEWSVFGLSLLLVLGILGFLGVQALTHNPTPPQLKPIVREIKPFGEQSLVEIEVENRGETAAQNIEVEAKFEKQNANFTLDLVAGRGKKSGFAIFKGRPAKKQIVARVLGFS